MNTNDKYMASDDANFWRYEVAPKGTKVALKTIGGMQTTGTWTGEYGEAFVAWAPLIKADKAKEELLRQHGFKKPWSELVEEGLDVRSASTFGFDYGKGNKTVQDVYETVAAEMRGAANIVNGEVKQAAAAVAGEVDAAKAAMTGLLLSGLKFITGSDFMAVGGAVAGKPSSVMGEPLPEVSPPQKWMPLPNTALRFKYDGRWYEGSFSGDRFEFDDGVNTISTTLKMVDEWEYITKAVAPRGSVPIPGEPLRVRWNNAWHEGKLVNDYLFQSDNGRVSIHIGIADKWEHASDPPQTNAPLIFKVRDTWYPGRFDGTNFVANERPGQVDPSKVTKWYYTP